MFFASTAKGLWEIGTCASFHDFKLPDLDKHILGTEKTEAFWGLSGESQGMAQVPENWQQENATAVFEEKKVDSLYIIN